ncbi:MAG: hypothetical protein K2P85_01865 [Flavobacteriaceae bacterium]|nr:hypothetical protein [Flavobacteriaceae bacterium]
MAQFKKCIKKYETRLEVLTEVSQSNIEELQKLNPIFEGKIEIGDFICCDEEKFSVLIDKNLKSKSGFNLTISKTTYLEISQDKTFILVKDHSKTIETFTIIETKDELLLAKHILSHWNKKQAKKGSIIIASKYHSQLFNDGFEAFNSQYDIVE